MKTEPHARPLPDDHPARRYRLGAQAMFTWANGDGVIGRLSELHQDRVEISRTRVVDGRERLTRHRCILDQGTLEVPTITEHPDCTHANPCPIHGLFTCPALRPGDLVVMPDLAPGVWGTVVAVRSTLDDLDEGQALLIDRGDVDENPQWWAPAGIQAAPTGFATALAAVRVAR